MVFQTALSLAKTPVQAVVQAKFGMRTRELLPDDLAPMVACSSDQSAHVGVPARRIWSSVWRRVRRRDTPSHHCCTVPDASGRFESPARAPGVTLNADIDDRLQALRLWFKR